MKEILNIGGGAVILSEQAGDFILAFNEQAAIGGGAAAGIIQIQGAGLVVLKGKMAFDLGMKLLEAHSPAALVPLEEGLKTIVDGAISGA